MNNTLYRVVLVVITVLLVFEFVRWKFLDQDASSPVVNVYSSRKEQLTKDLFASFTEQTGIEVRFVVDKAPKLIERLKSEGDDSVADVFLAADAGNLVAAKQAGVLQPISSDVLAANIPAGLRDEDSFWFGLSKRVRAIFYAPDRIGDTPPLRYEDLADPIWEKRLLIRSSSNIYNQSLIAWLIDAHGIEHAESIITGWVKNFARKPQGGDTDQLRAIHAKSGDIAIANSYYYGRLIASKDAKDNDVARASLIMFPNQDEAGAHVNISGGALVKHAPNKEEGQKLLEFLSEHGSQKIYAEINHEYPVHPDVERSVIVKSWGEKRLDDAGILSWIKYLPEASKLADRVGWR